MKVVPGCVDLLLFAANARELRRIRYGNETVEYTDGREQPLHCHDCSAMIGEYHHLGCDWEQCPNCEGQMLSCECIGEVGLN
jgi:hypothetical protein